MAALNDTGGVQKQAEEFFLTVSLLQTPDEVRDFMFDIFTEAEVLRAAKRWCITQRLIEDNYIVSVTDACTANKNTVSRARRTIVRNGSGICHIIHKRLAEYKEINA